MSRMYARARRATRHSSEIAAAAQRTSRLPQVWIASADLLDMRRSALVLLVMVTGCHLRAGYDAASRANGPLQAAMAQSSVSRSDGVINLPTSGGHNYSLEAGFGTKSITVNGVMAMQNVTSSSFTPGAGYLATTLGIDARWAILHWMGLSPTLAAGPARMLLLDRNTGERTWGNAVRLAVGAQYQLGPVAIYGDFYRESVAFSSGPATGNTTLEGVTVGLALQP